MTEPTLPEGARIVPCPTCKKPSVWHTDNRWRPFCCERCKAIDLGAWASDAYVIPGSAPSPEDEDAANAS